MKVKSSVILAKALELIQSGEQRYVCAAIQDVETQMRWDEGVPNIISKASKIWMTFKPPHVSDNLKNLQQWWDKGDPKRVETLTKAIETAKKAND